MHRVCIAGDGGACNATVDKYGHNSHRDGVDIIGTLFTDWPFPKGWIAAGGKRAWPPIFYRSAEKLKQISW